VNEISEEIIKGCARKDAGCQKIIYEKYYRKMYTTCLRYVNNADEAKDLLHDGFIKLFDKVRTFTEYPKFEAWMRRLFANHCIDYVRSAYKKNMVLMEERHEESASQEIQEDEVGNEFDVHQYSVPELVEAIGKLNPDYRLIINMYAIEQYSHQEIADKLGIEYSTSRSKLLRARQSLKKILSDNRNREQ
jgi:RNA polymerase sigma factor (sigma-70 family)